MHSYRLGGCWSGSIWEEAEVDEKPMADRGRAAKSATLPRECLLYQELRFGLRRYTSSRSDQCGGRKHCLLDRNGHPARR